jgi:hypothetical protein
MEHWTKTLAKEYAEQGSNPFKYTLEAWGY